MAYATRNCTDCGIAYRPKTSNQKRCQPCREYKEALYHDQRGGTDKTTAEMAEMTANFERRRDTARYQKKKTMVSLGGPKPGEEAPPDADDARYQEMMALLIADYDGDENAAMTSVEHVVIQLRAQMRAAMERCLGAEIAEALWDDTRTAIRATIPPSMFVEALLSRS